MTDSREDKAMRELWDESRKWLRSRGWHDYYHPNYWVHPKTVQDPEAQDYTNYGMPVLIAVIYEAEGRGPMPGHGLAGLLGSGARLNGYGGAGTGREKKR